MVKNKKNILYAIILFAIATFIWQLALFNQKTDETAVNKNSDTSSEQRAIHEEYINLPENNRFVKESLEQISERFENGTGAIMLGYAECAWCQKAAPLLNEAAEKENVSIYYLDIRQERDNNSTEYQELVTLLSPYLSKDEAGLPRITTPDISIVENGEIIWRYELEATTENERTPEAYWTEERKKRAIQNFQDQMKNLQE